MKRYLIFIFFLFVPYLIKAQGDSLQYKVFKEKINKQRASKSIKPVDFHPYYDGIAKEIMSKRSGLKDGIGNYNIDSVRAILRSKKIFHYQCKVFENSAGYKKGKFVLSARLQKELNDPLNSLAGIAYNRDENLVILVKQFVMVNSWWGTISVIEVFDKSVSIPEFWGIDYTTPLKEVKYICLERLEELRVSDVVLTAKANNGIVKIDSIKQNQYYIVLFNGSEIIYIHKR